jgi:2-C-methyl-D-erythritol 4-phosphate cytidylyltransferase / 2-C-methyl-D-erythritol 2,4-cyclodiphosphate synthase
MAAKPGAIAIIPAAGRGERSGLSIPKQYHRLGGKTMLAHSVLALAGFEKITAVLVVLDPHDEDWVRYGLDQELQGLPHVIALKIGGASRRDSVLAGLQLAAAALTGSGHDNPWVMVHDAARPGLTQDHLQRLWHALNPAASTQSATSAPSTQSAPSAPSARSTSKADHFSGGILALPVADTLKKGVGVSAANDHSENANNPDTVQMPVQVESTINRQQLWAAQTPQMFRLAGLITAYEQSPHATDEASAIEAAGGHVQLIPGSPLNLKLTQPEDFLLMEAFMASTASNTNALPPFAIGQGFDVHALVKGRPLIIGGVTIPFDKGLDGHSDADVLLHAITDAILGAAGLGDIGRHFPDTDPAYRGADSKALLTESVARVQKAGWVVSQIDATIIAQAPKISPYAGQMQAAIAQCCGMQPARVNIKGKTTEQLGFTGRGEGIAAQAVAMLTRLPA